MTDKTPTGGIDVLLEHYRNPRNCGNFQWQTTCVLVGEARSAPYNDLLRLKLKWAMLPCSECGTTGKIPSAALGSSDIEFVNCDLCRAFGSYYYIEDARHVSVGCGWLIASASWFSEYVKHKRITEIASLAEDKIIELSGLPWVANHCASLIKEATLNALSAGFNCLIDPV